MTRNVTKYVQMRSLGRLRSWPPRRKLRRMQTLDEVGRELLADIAAGRISGGSYGRMVEWIARLAASQLIPPFDYVSLLESLEQYGPH